MTGKGGLSFAAYLTKTNALVGLLEGLNATLTKRRRDATKAKSKLSQVYLLAIGEGHLLDLDDAREDSASRVLTGLGNCWVRVGSRSVSKKSLF